MANEMISVIVPVYKSENTLTRCVESVLYQTYTDYEVLLIVDGPPDQSGILAQSLESKHPKVRAIYQENQGVSKARNRGILEAKGDYIRFLDSDDYLSPDSLETLLGDMKQKECDFVVAGYHHLYYGRDILKRPSLSGNYEVIKCQNTILKLYEQGFLNMPWNKLYKKDLIKDGFPAEMNLGEDLIFNLHYLKSCKTIAVLQKPVCYYVQDEKGSSLSTKRREDRMDIAFQLWKQTKFALSSIYGDGEFLRLPEKILVKSLLDDLMEASFDTDYTKQNYEELIRQYYHQYLSFLKKTDEGFQKKQKLKYQKIDYALLYSALRRGSLKQLSRQLRLRKKILTVCKLR